MRRTLLCVLPLASFACSTAAPNDHAAPTPDSAIPVVDAPSDDVVVDTPAPVFDTDKPYPDGPYGMKKGLVYPNLTFDGYRDAKRPWTKLSMQDYYDPHGTRGVRALFVVVATQVCLGAAGPGKSLARWYADAPDDYRARGARFLVGMIDDGKATAPTQSSIDALVKRYEMNYDVAATTYVDLLNPTGSTALPTQVVINPRTMVIVDVISGFPYAYACSVSLEKLLEKNGADKRDCVATPDDAGVDTGVDDTSVETDADAGSD